jgi:glycerophosphoryl diester phosphodiesterase
MAGVADPLHPAFAPGAAAVFAHRGGAALAPENTLAAFDQAIALGVDGLELDVRLSRDGEVVVHHDATVDRTTDATGRVAAFTADELARLDAGYRFAAGGGYPFRGRGVGIPRLREVLARYPDVPVIIELKADDAALAARTVGEVEAARAAGRVALASFEHSVLAAVRRLAANLPTSASTREVRGLLWRARFGTTVRHPPYRVVQVPETRGTTRIVTPAFVRAAHRAGVAVQVWTVDAADDMRRLLDWGVDALITDRPDVAVAVVRAWRRAASAGGGQDGRP